MEQGYVTMVEYTCDGCGERIYIDINAKSCPKCGYENPMCKNIETKCSICGGVAMKDQYGNGECDNCGWKFSKDEEDFEKDLGISYPMLVSPTTARKQYQNKQPFKATFDEFVNGLKFYSEMLLKYNNVTYEVFLKNNYNVVFCSKYMQQTYNSIEDFKNKSNIEGKLLKDLWNEVSFAGFMYCG